MPTTIEPFYALFENEHTVVLLIDPKNGSLVDVNPAAERFYGWPRATMRTMHVFEINALTDEEIRQRMQQAESREARVFDFLHRRADGSLRNVRVSSGPVVLNDRKLLFSLIDDVTDLVQTREMLRLRDQALYVAASAIVLTDVNGRIVWCNPSFTRLTGFAEEEAIGLRPGDLIRSGRQDEAFYAELWGTIGAGRTWRGDLVNRRKDGTQYDEEMTITPVLDDDGRPSHYIAVKQDVTDRKRREAALARWRDVFEHMSAGIALSDGTGTRIAAVNPTYARLHAAEPSDLVGRPILELFPESERERVSARLEQAERHGWSRYEARRERPDGTSVITESTITHVESGGSLDAKFIATVQDVSRIHEVESTLRRSRVGTNLAMQAASFGTWTLDPDQRTYDVSDAWIRHLGYEPDDFIDADEPYNVRLIHPDDAERSKRTWQSFLTSPGQAYQDEFRMVAKDGSVRRILSRASIERDAAGRAVAVHGVDMDVTQLRNLSAQVDRLTFFDAVTGLPNRNGTLRTLDRRLTGWVGSDAAVVIVVGLDAFREINESLGYATGDELLRAVTSRLADHDEDPVLLGRTGGDQFVVALSSRPAGDDLDAKVREIQHRLTTPFDVAGHRLMISGSVGVAIAPGDGQNAAELVAHAEAAMHAAKRSSPGSVRYYARDIDDASTERIAVRSALASVLDEDAIEVAFQPQARLEDGAIYGFEALARWTHPEWGAVSPDRFVAEAERSGMIGRLGATVRRRALAALAIWLEAGWSGARVAVNVSARELDDPSWATGVFDDLREAGVEPRRLELEITETTAMTASSEGLEALSQLRAAGVCVAIDDFGTGYASLGQLQHLPADVLKIDKTFVARLADGGSDGDRELVRAMVRLAEAFDLDTIAEGVETDAQRALLTEFGCTAIQGWAFARPMSLDAANVWLEQRPPPTRTDDLS